ncbi:hypothetical protein B0H16DRAFT_1709743 [Mycena metata]|uniref:Uncharacterized protein n=1 Tax=Mycena metata TaxID=1033252 RepID=A0AAD7KGR9_9AGAR|nr:hypothetical protein B0H16DRAFT_1734420 [Mycena metata]KAJ7782918.1 hypothetical protein B0H16DRAFT_1709743 [Mycena metata]
MQPSLSPPPSSHASSMLRHALRSPTPSPPPVVKVKARLFTPTTTPPTRKAPRYLLFGLDFGASDSSSTIGDTVDDTESAAKAVRPLVLPPFCCARPQQFAMDFLPDQRDVFGPVRRKQPIKMPLRAQTYTQRCVDARLAAHSKQLRTAAWVKRIRGE